MANIMDKVGEKLHMGSHKKEEPAVAASQTTPVTTYGQPQTTPVTEYGQAQQVRHDGTTHLHGQAAPHESPLDKVKNTVKGSKDKVKTKKGGRGKSGSGSSSDSD